MRFYESEEHEIAVLIRYLELLMTKTRKNELSDLDISPQQIGVLRFIQKLKTPCTIMQLCQVMQRSNSSLVAIINRLEQKGLVKRIKDNHNKRYTRVCITKNGKDLYEKAVNRQAFNSIIGGLTPEDRHKLKEFLTTLIKTGEEILNEQKSNT